MWESHVLCRHIDTSGISDSYVIPVAEFTHIEDTTLAWSKGWLLNLTELGLTLRGPSPIKIWSIEDADITFTVKCLILDYHDVQQATNMVTKAVPQAEKNAHLARVLAISRMPVGAFYPESPGSGNEATIEKTMGSSLSRARKPYFATDVTVLKVDDTFCISRLMGSDGIFFKNGENLSFHICTITPEALGFRNLSIHLHLCWMGKLGVTKDILHRTPDLFEFYVPIEGESKVIGYSYLLPLIKDDTTKLTPIFGANALPIGELQVDYMFITPLPDIHLDMKISYQNYWECPRKLHSDTSFKLVPAHQTKKIVYVQENTIASFRAALLLHNVDYVKFHVQLCKDKVPVMGHELFIYITHQTRRVGAPEIYRIAIKELTVAQLQASKLTDYSNSVINIMEDESANSGELQPFPTLQEVLQHVDKNVGFLIEVKFPPMLETGGTEPVDYFDRNQVVDSILEVVFAYHEERKIMFTSLDADTCITLQRKQNRFPVLFQSWGLNPDFWEPYDVRSRSLEAAVHFAVSEHLLGVHLLAEEIVKDLKIIRKAHSFGLVVFAWDTGTVDSRIPDLLRINKVDGLVADRILFSSSSSIGSDMELYHLSRQVGRIALRSSQLVYDMGCGLDARKRPNVDCNPGSSGTLASTYITYKTSADSSQRRTSNTS